MHVVVPKAEAAARALLVELDEGIYRIGLGKILVSTPASTFSWTNSRTRPRRIMGVLPALALPRAVWHEHRNEIAHGFVTDVGPVYAALVLLRAASMLITVAAPQPPSTVAGACHSGDRAVDLAELPIRDRDDVGLQAACRTPCT